MFPALVTVTSTKPLRDGVLPTMRVELATLTDVAGDVPNTTVVAPEVKCTEPKYGGVNNVYKVFVRIPKTSPTVCV